MSDVLDLDAIAARAAAATPGPWLATTDNGRRDGIGIVGRAELRGTGRCIAVFAGVEGDRAADAHFTAHARTDVPALLAVVRAAYEFADAMATFCSPHGVATDYAVKLREHLDQAAAAAVDR